MNGIACIASDDTPLWECPCAACTRLEWEARDDSDEHVTLAQHRTTWWPEQYPAKVSS